MWPPEALPILAWKCVAVPTLPAPTMPTIRNKGHEYHLALVSGSLEGLHCDWQHEEQIIILRHELEPGQKVPHSCPVVSCCCWGWERLPLYRISVSQVPRLVSGGPRRKEKHLFFWIHNTIKFHLPVISPNLSHLPCSKIALFYWSHSSMIIFLLLQFITTWKFILKFLFKNI